MLNFVDASPAKRFFVEMLIRDIRLEDAVLDLVDNAIDSLIRHENIDLPHLLSSLTDSNEENSESFKKRSVSINITTDKFQITDNCGGIGIDQARENVFRFGAQEKLKDTHLSVYGIGLKRAVLKIGRLVSVESKTLESGFRVTIDVNKFDQSNTWQFPIESTSPARESHECGTTITVNRITEESRCRLSAGTFESNLVSAIGQSYSLFLEKFVSVRMNGHTVQPITIPLSDSVEMATSLRKLEFQDVAVTVVAGLQSLDGKDWRGNTAGSDFVTSCAVLRHWPPAGANPARRTVVPAGSNRSGSWRQRHGLKHSDVKGSPLGGSASMQAVIR